jgi:O-antigen/teichoic acid export membrane protein
MISQSLKKRYLAKLATNLVGLVIGLFTMAIIPRGLGPKAYGDFSFLTDFFNQLIGLFTLATSIGFFTKLSQRQNEFGLISFYGQFTAIAIIAMFFFIGGSQLIGVSKTLWINQNMMYVYMAALFSVLTWLVMLMTQVVDAYGLTVSTEIAKIIQKLIGVFIVLLLFFANQLNLANFFYYNYLISILLVLAFLWIIGNNSLSFFRNWRLSKEQIKNYSKEFYNFSHPLFLYAIIGLITGVFDRWLLQKYAGSVQQGYFGLSLQIGAICFIFTSAMTPLITRELAIAHKDNDIKEMARLFRRYIPMLYAIAAFFSCFASVQAEKITSIFAGKQYLNAVIPITIMALYPIHQTYGQLSGSVFYASGQTKLYRNIGLIFMILGLPVLYFALAPVNQLGFNAGATGLALKFLLIQFIVVNVQLFFNSKYLKLNFLKYFGHQIICVGLFLGIAFISKIIIDLLIQVNDNIILGFLMSGILYSVLIILLVYFFPAIFGLFKIDIKKGIDAVFLYVKN